MTIALLALALTVTTFAGASSPKRTLPDQDGRGNPDAQPSGWLWVPRVILAPPYLVSEYLVRRPLGFLIAGSERAGLPSLLYDTFAFGPDHRGGIVPIAFVDFGFRPSFGLYAFWDDAFVRGHDLRLHLATGGSNWFAGSFAERVHLSRVPFDVAALELSASRRPDYVFFGLGPRTPESPFYRYGADRLEARVGFDQRLWRQSSFRARVGLRSVDFRHGVLGSDLSLDREVDAGHVAAPPGFPRGYTIATSSLVAALDTREAAPASGSGVRVGVNGALASETRQRGSWLTYGGSLTGFLDLNQQRRVLSLALGAEFVDALAGAVIPFTELIHLGGSEPMRGFARGRLLDRSAAVADLGYTWPIWVFLNGALHFEVGNVFGERLENFDPKLLRFSGTIGVESTGSPDNTLQILFGVGSETFDTGAKIDSIRFLIGTTHGF